MLPSEGDILTLTVSRDLAKLLNFTQDEIAKCDLSYDKNNKAYTWNQEHSFTICVDFSPKEILLLKEQVEIADKAKKINVRNLDLCVMIKEL